MHSKSRKLIGIVAAAAIALSMSGCASNAGSGDDDSGNKVDPVKVGYIGDYSGTSLFAIADKEGLWKKHDLKPQMSVFTNGPLQIQALKTDDLDIGYIGPGAMWMPISGQAQVLTVNGVGQADRVIAQSGITDIKQLKGKKIGVPEGTSGDMIFSLALKQAGMSYKDVQKVTMTPATVVSAFASKQIDAAGLWYPLIGTIKKQVPDLNELAQDSDFSSSVNFPNVIVGGNDFVKNKPDVAKKVEAVLKDAMTYRAAHQDETISLVAKMLKIDKATVAADAKNVQVYSAKDLESMTNDGTIDSWFSGMSDYFVGAGKVTTPKPVKSYYVGDLFTSAGK